MKDNIRSLFDQANEAVKEGSEKRIDLINSVIALYSTVSSALILFAFNGVFTEVQSILLLISIGSSILIVFSTLLIKYLESIAPLQTFRNMDMKSYVDGEIVSTSPNKATTNLLFIAIITLIILVPIQLIVSFLLAYAKC